MRATRYDVIIFGAGLTGCALGLILARQGLKPLLIDRTAHPRFALGESLLKPTVLWLQAMARRFGVPELGVIANLNRIHEEIGTSSGIKKSFGFVRHRPGQTQTTAQWWANIPVNYPEDVLEAHLFRQDIDGWLHARAVAAGCDTIIGVVEEAATSGADGAFAFRTDEGVVEGDYVVDTTGQSPIALRLGLREEPSRLRTHSRSLYTHLIGARPFDACGAAPAPALPWHQGTLHHLLDGAWMWVIPFDNHPGSTNPLVSVGVNFDNRLHPDRGLPPAQEWAELLAQYPVLQAQFGQARAVRPWVSTGRVQRSASAVTDARFCLLGQAGGNVDALFSRGLLNSMQSTCLLAELLLEAFATRDFGQAHRAPLERLHRSLMAVHDTLVHGTYIGFRAQALTDWWLALWSFVERLSLAQVEPLRKALESADTAAVTAAFGVLKEGNCIHEQPLLLGVLEDAAATMEQYAAGALEETATLGRLVEAGEALRALGFDVAQFRELSTRAGFEPLSARLLGLEHGLTAAIELMDRHGGWGVSLRKSTLLNAIVRLLALRYARQEEVFLQAPEVGAALQGVMDRWSPPGHLKTAAAGALVASLRQLRLSVNPLAGNARRPALPAGWLTVLECHAQGRFVRLGLGVVDGEMALEALTEAAGQRTVVAASLAEGTDWRAALA